jgi:hypothetical protein
MKTKFQKIIMDRKRWRCGIRRGKAVMFSVWDSKAKEYVSICGQKKCQLMKWRYFSSDTSDNVGYFYRATGDEKWQIQWSSFMNILLKTGIEKINQIYFQKNSNY